MSKHNAEFIMRKMPYARGLDFRTLYWKSKGYEIESGIAEAPLDVIID